MCFSGTLSVRVCKGRLDPDSQHAWMAGLERARMSGERRSRLMAHACFTGAHYCSTSI